MPDQIEKDDEKFNQMIVKQHPTADSFFRAERAVEGRDPIEQDDEKIEDLMMLQSLSSDDENPVYASLEEKYEEKIIMDEVSEIVARQLAKLHEEDDKRP